MLSYEEKRRFVRVKTNLYAILDRKVQVAIKMLSLGGCLIEAPRSLAIKEPVRLDFSVEGEHVKMIGTPVPQVSSHHLGLKFRLSNKDETVRLMKAIEKIQHAPANPRPKRMAVEAIAIVDHEPSLVTNVSEGGCYVKTTAGYALGDIVDVRCMLEDREIGMTAQVRWRGTDGIGVQWLSPDQRQIDWIADFIAHRAPPTESP
jgi:hypothetical protein